MSVSRLARLVAVASAVLALGACSAGAATPPAPVAPAGAPAAAPPGAAPAEEGVRPALTAREVADLGTVLVDQEGYTLYRFDEDSAKPPEATCVDECAEKWPPFVVDRDGKL